MGIKMNIQGFQKTTLLDYPHRVAATVFLGGCNFRCPFCHNSSLVLQPGQAPAFSREEILIHLKKRRSILDGVCISGGEPTLAPDLSDFLDDIKDMGLLIKLDTNGYRPDVLKNLTLQGLVDYVAMDVKGSASDYGDICGISDFKLSHIQESMDFLMEKRIDFEFRTTVVKELHNKNDFESIGKWIAGAPAYYLQNYLESKHVISSVFSSYNKEELEVFRKILKNYIPLVEIRGVES